MELVEDKAAEAEETPSSSGSNEGAFNEETGEINWDCPVSRGSAVLHLDPHRSSHHLETLRTYLTGFHPTRTMYSRYSFLSGDPSRPIPLVRIITDPPQCLGGMAHGPCGEQFKAAFSCFVFSEAEPKGVDCVELFKSMQDCFREHPDVYGEGECGSSAVSTCIYTASPYSIPIFHYPSHLDCAISVAMSVQSQSHNCHPIFKCQASSFC
jgi:intermembrane space import and assembly protein 40